MSLQDTLGHIGHEFFKGSYDRTNWKVSNKGLTAGTTMLNGYAQFFANFSNGKNVGVSYNKSMYNEQVNNLGKLQGGNYNEKVHEILKHSVTYDAQQEAKILARQTLGDAIIFNAHTGGALDSHVSSATGYAQLGMNSGLGVSWENDYLAANLNVLGGKSGFIPQISAGVKFDDGINRSTQDLNFVAKLGFPDIISADINYTSNGKTFAFTASINPITTIGSLVTGIVNWFNSDRQGAFYEAIEPDTRPMKGVYGSDKLFEGSPPKLTDYGVSIAKIMQQDLAKNPNATMYIGEYKQKGLKSEDQELAQQLMLQAITGGDENLSKRISIGTPPESVKNQELIRANYANIVIANPDIFEGSRDNSTFIGLNSTENLNLRKEISRLPQFKELVSGKGRDEKEALLNFTMSKLIFGKAHQQSFTAEQVLQLAKQTVYDKGITLSELTRVETADDNINKLLGNEAVKNFFAEHKITDKDDQARCAKFILSQNQQNLQECAQNGATPLTLAQLLQNTKAEIVDKNINEKSLTMLAEMSERHLENMIKNPRNEIEKVIGQVFKSADSLNKTYMVSTLSKIFTTANDNMSELSDGKFNTLDLTTMGATAALSLEKGKTPFEVAKYLGHAGLLKEGDSVEASKGFLSTRDSSLHDEKRAYYEQAKQELPNTGLAPSDYRQAVDEKVLELVAKDLRDYRDRYGELVDASQKGELSVALAKAKPEGQVPSVNLVAMEGKSSMQQKPANTAVENNGPEVNLSNSGNQLGFAPA